MALKGREERKMNQKGYTITELIISIIFFIVLVGFVCSLLLVMKDCSRAVDNIQELGLKNVIEEVWEGKQKERKGEKNE